MAISDTDILSVYNGALRRLGARKLASLSENREPRRVMDDIWDGGDIVRSVLELADWNFALRAVESLHSSSIETGFGFSKAHTKPDDFIRLAALSFDDYFRQPLTDHQYTDEAGYWLTDWEVIYVRYVSSGDTFGFNSAAWSESFTDYLEAKMAWEACERLTNSTTKRDRLERDMMRFLSGAKSLDARGEGVKFPPTGSWVSARGGGWGERRER